MLELRLVRNVMAEEREVRARVQAVSFEQVWSIHEEWREDEIEELKDADPT